MPALAEWRLQRLGEVATLKRGFDLPARLRRDGKVPVITSAGQTSTHDLPAVNGPGVVTGRYGTIGQTFFLDCDYWPHNTTLFVSDFHGNDPQFIYYLLKTIDFASHSGKSGVPGVNRNDLHELLVNVPVAQGDQRQIAEALRNADELIISLEQLVAKKQAIKQGMMQQLLTGKTRLPGFGGEWAKGRLGALYARHNVVVDPRLSRSTLFRHFSLPAFDAGKQPIVERGDSIDSHKFAVPEHALLVSKLNPRIPRIWAPKHVGQNAVASTEFIVAMPVVGVDASFLKWLFRSAKVAGQMKLLATGTTGSHTRIHPTQVADIAAQWPGHAEQVAIAEAIDSAEAEIAALARKLVQARRIKQGMMQELLTGRTRLTPTEATA